MKTNKDYIKKDCIHDAVYCGECPFEVDGACEVYGFKNLILDIKGCKRE